MSPIRPVELDRPKSQVARKSKTDDTQIFKTENLETCNSKVVSRQVGSQQPNVHPPQIKVPFRHRSDLSQFSTNT